MSDLDWTAPSGAVFTYGELWELRAFALQAEADKISEGSFARKALDRLNFVLDGGASTQPPSPQAEVQDCEQLKAALRWVRDFASEQMPEEEGLLAVVDEALAPARGESMDDQIDALAKARRERGRGDTLPWDELPEMAKGPIRRQAAEEMRNGTGKQPPAEPQGDVVAVSSRIIDAVAEHFPDDNKYALCLRLQYAAPLIRAALALEVKERLEAVERLEMHMDHGLIPEPQGRFIRRDDALAALTPAPSEPDDDHAA